MIAQERTYWRDYELYSIIRTVWNVRNIIYSPLPDDICLLEYTTGYTDCMDSGAALVYYTYHKRNPRFYHTNIRVLQSLAKRAGIPLLHARYWIRGREPYFYVVPVYMCEPYITQSQLLNETEFVDLLYSVRNLSFSPTYIQPSRPFQYCKYCSCSGASITNGTDCPQLELYHEPIPHIYPSAFISQKHRSWGYKCLATDIDTIVYNGCYEPTAIVEYKMRNTLTTHNTDTSPFRAIAQLATSTNLPFFSITYTIDSPRTLVCGNNHLADDVVALRYMDIHELQEFFQQLVKTR